MTRLFLALAGAALLAGCSLSPKDYETAPVTVNTAAGPVTCQLYTHQQVTWDRATSRPASMSVAQGDAICREEGYRVMRGGRSTLAAAPAVAVAPGATAQPAL